MIRDIVIVIAIRGWSECQSTGRQNNTRFTTNPIEAYYCFLIELPTDPFTYHAQKFGPYNILMMLSVPFITSQDIFRTKFNIIYEKYLLQFTK